MRTTYPIITGLVCCLFPLGKLAGKKITLSDFCEQLKTESVVDGRRLSKFTYHPVIDNDSRKLTWTWDDKHFKLPGMLSAEPILRKRLIVTLDQGFEVRSISYTAYLNSLSGKVDGRMLKQFGHQKFKALVTSATDEVASEINGFVNAFALHMGYPSPSDKDGVFTLQSESMGALEFGGRKFEPSKFGKLIKVTAHPEKSPEGSAYLIRTRNESIETSLQRGSENQTIDGVVTPQSVFEFESRTTFFVELLSEDAVKQSVNVEGAIDGNVIRRIRKEEPTIRGGLKKMRLQTVPENSIAHFLKTYFVPEEFKSRVMVMSGNLDHRLNYKNGDLIQSIEGKPVRNKEQLQAFLNTPPEKLGESVKVVILSKSSTYGTNSGYWELKEFDLAPDHREMERQRALIAEQAKIEENARQSVITLHEKERAEIAKNLIEFRKEAELEVLKTKEGIMRLVRSKTQPATKKFVDELAKENPLAAISYLKYLADVLPDALSEIQRAKLYGVVWLEQDTRFDSYAHIDPKAPNAMSLLTEHGLQLTAHNSKPTKVTLAKGEMVYHEGHHYLPLDHPEVLLAYIMDEDRKALTPLNAFQISDCGICTSSKYFYFPDSQKTVYENLAVSGSRPTLAAYQEIIVSMPRQYESFEVPKPKKRTLTGLMAKGWLAATVGANTLLLGAEFAGVDTNDLLDRAQKASYGPKPKPASKVSVIKMTEQREAKSNWTGKRKGEVQTLKLSDGRTIKIQKSDEKNGSVTWMASGWTLNWKTAQELHLSSEKYFKTKDELLAWANERLNASRK